MTREEEKEGEGGWEREWDRERENIDHGVVTKHRIFSLCLFSI